MTKSLFIDENETEKIDIAEGFWVKIPKQISYKTVQEIDAERKSRDDTLATTKFIFVKLIKEWNLTEADGKPAEINEANINRLGMETVAKLNEIVIPKMVVGDKKKEPTSKES